MVLSFLEDAHGVSPARTECKALLSLWPREVWSILAHVQAVEQIGSKSNNGPLSQAQPVSPPPPDLFWREVNGIGAFYVYDGTDLAVILMDRVSNSSPWSALLTRAQGRICCWIERD